MGGDGGCRVSEVQAGATSPMPDHKGFKLQQLVNFQKFSTLRDNYQWWDEPGSISDVNNKLIYITTGQVSCRTKEKKYIYLIQPHGGKVTK